MQLKDKIIVITGAASGIGRAMAQRFAAEGAKLIVCADRDEAGAKATAAGIGGVAFKVDVASEADIQGLIETVERDHGPIDLFCSNAGIGVGGGAEASNTEWQRIWDINVMAHVWAARHLVPRMAARGGG
jgi:NAD(P)-dependent dehydrogenase (short-subunit alcohol dehydrogenase family)